MRLKFTPMILLASAMVVAMPNDGYSQGFLKKLKQKAENSIGKAIGIQEEPAAATYNENNAESNAEENAYVREPNATDKLPKLRQSSVVWDGEVVPSKAANYHALMNELPPLPSVEQMINPRDYEMNAYNSKLSSLSMRADELDDQMSCSDDEMVAMRDKLYKEMEAITGLTPQEMKRLEDSNVSPEEKARLEQKMRDNILGGADINAMETSAIKNKPRMDEIQKEMAVYEKKLNKGQQLTDAEMARMQELSAETMKMHQEMMGNSGNLMGNLGKMNQMQDNLLQQTKAFNNQLNEYTKKLEGIRTKEDGVVKNCNQIAAEYEDELRAIYKQIWDEDDAEKIHTLYDRADELMKNYRTRAAAIFRQGLVVRLENAKKLLPEAEKVYSSMANDGIIPQCAVQRAPLNVVIECIDILEDAYSDFPQPSVVPYKEKVITIAVKEGEHILNGESGYGGTYGTGGIASFGSGSGGATAMEEDFINNSTFLVYNSLENCYYEIKNGVRTRLSGEGPFNYNFAKKREESAYGEIQLRGGGRSAVYNRGGSLILHDGTYCFPIAMQRNGEWLEFIMNGEKEGEFVLCSYKL